MLELEKSQCPAKTRKITCLIFYATNRDILNLDRCVAEKEFLTLKYLSLKI